MDEVAIPEFVGACIVSKGLEISGILGLKKDAIMYVQPCASERGKLMADIEFSKNLDAEFFDTKVLCSLLETHRRRFAELKCSPSLGVAKVKWKGREMSIFKNGKLKIQRAPTREEIVRIANSTARLIWGAVFCEVCGKPALVCASGGCRKCKTGETKANLKEIPGGDLLRHALDSFEAARSSPQDAGKNHQKAKYFALHFVEETPDKKTAAAGLALISEVESSEGAKDQRS